MSRPLVLGGPFLHMHLYQIFGGILRFIIIEKKGNFIKLLKQVIDDQ